MLCCGEMFSLSVLIDEDKILGALVIVSGTVFDPFKHCAVKSWFFKKTNKKQKSSTARVRLLKYECREPFL